MEGVASHVVLLSQWDTRTLQCKERYIMHCTVQAHTLVGPKRRQGASGNLPGKDLQHENDMPAPLKIE